ncbi:hypothetical protein [Streptomyces bambusae]|uniref:Uncharacterized protein n=1 Tax=Streptomyces bambusae TaxID=1550616 RepID=A0ABS6ZH68_9ACTN|nr:hypothetical protein [Streptomyces bambusae]MBW5486558.1 hypothetical protein [Streptomyces bambusae]
MSAIRIGAKATAIAVLAVSMLGSTAYAAPQAAAATTKSWACSSPSWETFNTSYSNGLRSTKVYFNNHCSHQVKYHVRILNTKDQVTRISPCVTAYPNTKSYHTFSKGLIDDVVAVVKGC